MVLCGVLGPLDPLPARPRRVLVAGTAGSGKTTLARRIGAVLGVPSVEVDALFHGPGWTRRPSFEAEVEAFTARPAWACEWQYADVRPLLASRADLLVWLDLPLRTILRQVGVRTLRRRLWREALWGINVEPPLWTFLTDREHIVRWAWRTHNETASRVAWLLGAHPELPVIRLTSRRAVDGWLAGPLAAEGLRCAMDWKLELVVVPVSDVDRAKEFYLGPAGFNLLVDHSAGDFRVVQATPPGSACSIALMPSEAAGSVRGLHLVVSDLPAARSELLARGVEAGEIFHYGPGGQQPGLDPARGDYSSFLEFADPDGNSWLVQDVPSRSS